MSNKRKANMLFKSTRWVINLNKKAVQMGWETILTIAVLAVLGYFLFSIFRPTASEAGTFFSTETLKFRDQKCKFDTERSEITLQREKNDKDGDGRLDSCDVCVCANPNCATTSDEDLDGMPNGCDKVDNDRTVIGCVFVVTKDNRCVEGGPPSAK